MLLGRVKADFMEPIKFEEWQWKVSYGMPAHGKDFWGKKAEERAKLEKETGKRKRKSKKFGWMKKNRSTNTLSTLPSVTEEGFLAFRGGPSV